MERYKVGHTCNTCQPLRAHDEYDSSSLVHEVIDHDPAVADGSMLGDLVTRYLAQARGRDARVCTQLLRREQLPCGVGQSHHLEMTAAELTETPAPAASSANRADPGPNARPSSTRCLCPRCACVAVASVCTRLRCCTKLRTPPTSCRRLVMTAKELPCSPAEPSSALLGSIVPAIDRGSSMHERCQSWTLTTRRCSRDALTVAVVH